APGDAHRCHPQAAPQDHERAARPEAREAPRRRRGGARPVQLQVRPMSSPTERPVPEDSAPEQRAADIVGATATPDTTIDRQVPGPDGREQRGTFSVSRTGDASGFGGLVREPWVASAAERPYGGYFDELVDALYEAYPQAAEAISKVVVDRGELTLHIEREHLIGIAGTLRDN